MDYEEKGGVVRDVRTLIEDYAQPQIIDVAEPGTGLTVPVVFKGDEVQFIDRARFDGWRDNPLHRTGTATLTRLESLIDHVNRFKNAESALFADEDRAHPGLTAVLDYHDRVNISDDLGSVTTSDARPRFGRHRSAFNFPLSDEWNAWQKHNATPMAMADFARFLEDRIVDVIEMIPNEDTLPEPLQKFITTCGGVVASPARLVELSRNLQVFEKAVVGEAVNLSSGEAQIEINSEHQDKHGFKLVVPNVFLIAIPVFQHDMLYRIAARLRYRKQGGLVFWYELWRADNAFDDAFGNACQRVSAETGLPLLFGQPE